MAGRHKDGSGLQKRVQNALSLVESALVCNQLASAMKLSRIQALALVSVFVCRAVPAGAEAPATDRSGDVKKALQLVQQYVAVEQASAGERVKSRREMLEFSFRRTRENGSQRVLSERGWQEWELGRPEAVQRLQLIGEPKAESIGNDLVRVHCAVHVNRIESGENWEGVSVRSYDVRIGDEEPRIRHERLLAVREGIKPGQWKKLRKTDNGVRSNLRSSPTSRKNNILGQLESNEAVHVWDQEKERWLFIRTAKGLAGFVHRSPLDFQAAPEELGTPHEEQGSSEVRRKKNYPFALVLPGRDGYVLNPYTNSIVDVRGLRAGTLVRDPRDPGRNRAFRVPFQGTPGRAVIADED